MLCRLNSWLSMLFPLGTWSSLCISHELFRLHRDSTTEANTLNYTVTLGTFTGGGLLLESESGDHSHFVEELNRNLKFCLVDTRDQPLAFDGTLWRGTAPFQGDRWVVTAYTCRNLDKMKDSLFPHLMHYHQLRWRPASHPKLQWLHLNSACG